MADDYDKARKEISRIMGLISFQECQVAAEKIEQLTGSDRDKMLIGVVASKEVWRPIIMSILWANRALLDQLQIPRMEDLCRGGVNAASKILEVFEGYEKEYEEKQRQARADQTFDSGNPLPEPQVE